MTPPVYLDHAATTPLGPEAREAMEPYLSEKFGNASEPHAYGREARAALEGARRTVAELSQRVDAGRRTLERAEKAHAKATKLAAQALDRLRELEP